MGTTVLPRSMGLKLPRSAILAAETTNWQALNNVTTATKQAASPIVRQIMGTTAILTQALPRANLTHCARLNAGTV